MLSQTVPVGLSLIAILTYEREHVLGRLETQGHKNSPILMSSALVMGLFPNAFHRQAITSRFP